MRPALAMPLLLLAAGCASAPPRQDPPPPSPPGAPEIRAVRVSTPPMVDGSANDPAWAQAPETVVKVAIFGDGVARLRAVVHRESLYLVVQWKDTTETGREYAANPPVQKSPRERTMYADVLAVEFPIGADSAGGEAWDRWVWDAASIDSSGHATDTLCTRSGNGGALDLFDLFGYPGNETTIADLDRSAEDVLARGRWKDGEWTVEFARAFSTGHADDRDLGGIGECPFRIYMLNGHRFDMKTHSASPVLRLLLPPPLPVDHQGPFPEPRGAPRERR